MGIFGSGRSFKLGHQKRHLSSSVPPAASLITQRKLRSPHKKASSLPLGIKRLKEHIARSQSRLRGHATAATTFYTAHHRPGTSFLLLNRDEPSDICFHRLSPCSIESSSSSSSTASLALPSSAHSIPSTASATNSNCILSSGSGVSQPFRIHPIYVRKQRTATHLTRNPQLIHVPRPIHASLQDLAFQHPPEEASHYDDMDHTPSLSATSSLSSPSSLSLPSTPSLTVGAALCQRGSQPSSHAIAIGDSKSSVCPMTAVSTNTLTGSRSDIRSDPFGEADTSDPVDRAQQTHLLQPQHHEHLQLLKREAFQELASQTQRNNDIFIAKMIYWESLSAEERSKCPLASDITGQDDSTLRRSDTTENDPEVAMASVIDQNDMDELVSALECRATVKDYSALIAFEQQAELERLKRQHQRRHQDPSAWEYEY